MKRISSLSVATLIGFAAALTAGYTTPTFGQLPAETENTEEVTPEAVVSEETDVEETDVEEAETVETETTETDAEAAEAETDAEPVMSAEERVRRKLIIEADIAYENGDFAEARRLYREAKEQTWLLPHQFSNLPPEPFVDPTLLRPGAAVYWREAQAGIENDRLSQTLSALTLLTTEYPEFIPGNVEHAAVLQANERGEEAAAVLERALTRYPANTELLLAQVDLMMGQEQWLEAAIASRQFVALNGDHAEAPAQLALAEENLQRFQNETQASIRNGAIANLFTGILGYAFTGSIFGPFTAANSALLLLQGENAIGNQFANQIEQQLPMLQHPEALGYVRNLGHRLSEATGRRDLDYEFFVILDPNLNAFALPGGKIFVNAGAILDTRSEAELAGLLAHELSHSVLSHGFQIATRGNLTSSVAQYLPYGGLINNVFMSGYSRDMERQADIVGTQILAASGYAADGVYNVMVTLNEQAVAQGRNVPTWISSHPNPADRVGYLQTLVERGGYDRYAYEGISRHEEIQAIVARELANYQAQQAAQNGEGTENTAPAEDNQPEEQGSPYDAVERFDW